MGVCLYIPCDMSSDRTFLEPFSKLGEVRKIEEAPGLAALPARIYHRLDLHAMTRKRHASSSSTGMRCLIRPTRIPNASTRAALCHPYPVVAALVRTIRFTFGVSSGGGGSKARGGEDPDKVAQVLVGVLGRPAVEAIVDHGFALDDLLLVALVLVCLSEHDDDGVQLKARLVFQVYSELSPPRKKLKPLSTKDVRFWPGTLLCVLGRDWLR